MIRLLKISLCVALLAGATALRADIVYNPADFLLGDVWQGAEFFDLDVDGNGSVDFSLQASLSYFSGIHPEGQNQYLIHPSPPPNIGGLVAALDFDYNIGSTPESSAEEWYGSENYSTLIYVLSTGSTGEFLSNRGFVGLQFESAEGTHYGWLDIEGVSGRSQLMIRGWAYESTPGAGITAGAIPEPSSIILFAIGIITLRFIRHHRKLY